MRAEHKRREPGPRGCGPQCYPVSLGVVGTETAAIERPFGVRRQATLPDGADQATRSGLYRVAARGAASRSRPARHLTVIGLVVLLGASGSAASAGNEASAATSPGGPAHLAAPVAPRPATGTNTLTGASGNGSAWPAVWTSRDPCRGAFHGPQRGSLLKTTSAGPNGSTVLPGQTITVTLTWKPTDFQGDRPSETDDCVEIGSRVSRVLSQVHPAGPSGGSDTFSYVVPSGGTGGRPICDRGEVSGSSDGSSRDHGGAQNEGWRQDGTEESAVLCYFILAAATPEVSNVLFLPLAGLVVGSGALLVVRRRRNGPESHRPSHDGSGSGDG
jgi:hypothetical protein